MYDINADLAKVDLAMLKTAYDLDAIKELAIKVINGYKQLLNEKDLLTKKLMNLALENADTLETAQQLKNVTDFIYYLKFRKDLIERRLQAFKNVHPSRADNLGQINPWDTEESLLSWKKIKSKVLR